MFVRWWPDISEIIRRGSIFAPPFLVRPAQTLDLTTLRNYNQRRYLDKYNLTGYNTMCQYIYYTKHNGRQPAAIFMDRQPVNIRADIDAKVRKLRENGVDVLINTAMVGLLGPKELYELRNRGLGWRVAFYFDRGINTFVLLCGFKKQRNLQPSDVEQARRYLKEYLSGRN